MRSVRLFWTIVRRCHFESFLIGFLICFFLVAAVILAVEPSIDRYGDAAWYTFVACTSIGFGDFAAQTFIGRTMTVFITIYEIILVALLAGVIVSHYIEVIHRREKLTATQFLDRLEHLTQLSPKELQEIEDKVHDFSQQMNRGIHE